MATECKHGVNAWNTCGACALEYKAAVPPDNGTAATRMTGVPPTDTEYLDLLERLASEMDWDNLRPYLAGSVRKMLAAHMRDAAAAAQCERCARFRAFIRHRGIHASGQLPMPCGHTVDDAMSDRHAPPNC